MSGWSTLTVELIDHETYRDDHDSSVDYDAHEAWQEYAEQEDLQYFSGCSEATNYRPEHDTHHSYLMVVIGGRYSEARVFTFLDQFLDYTTGRAVAIHANDTSDTGTAYLYVRRDDEWKEADTVGEKQLHEGMHKGQYAAACMYAKYGIPAIAKRHMTTKNTEVDKYSHKTLHSRPR